LYTDKTGQHKTSKTEGAKPSDFLDSWLIRELNQSGFVKSVLASAEPRSRRRKDGFESTSGMVEIPRLQGK
jgi:hypothetical protein